MRKAVAGVILAILVATSLGVGYLAGSGGAHTVTSTSTTTVVSSATIENTVTSTITVGVPINASDIASTYASIPGRPYELVVDPNDSIVYVTDQFSNSLTTLDQSPFAQNTTILPSSSDGIAIDYNTNVVYVGVTGGLEEINTTLVSIPVGGGVTNELRNQVVGVLPVNIKGPLTFDSSTHVIYGTSGNICTYLAGVDTHPICTYLAGVDVQTGAVVANVSLGYPADSIAVDPQTGMVFAAGCGEQYPVCDSIASVVNGTSGRIVASLRLNSSRPPAVVVNPTTNLAYVSGDQLVALNGTNGDVVYKVNPLECSGINNLVVIPHLNEVAATVPGAYVLVYDGSTGALVDMYSLPANANFVAFDPAIDQLIVTLWGLSLQGVPVGALIAFNVAASRGSVDSALVNGNGGTC
jgi:hypothetical protein